MRTATSTARLRPLPVSLAVGLALVLLGACSDEDPPSGDPPDDAEEEPADPGTDDPDEAPDAEDEAADPGDGSDGTTDDEGDEGDEGDEDDAEDADADGAQPAPDADLSVGITLTEVASMSSPVAGAVGPDEVLYLADRGGTIHRFEDGAVSDPVVDISDETTTDGERGLLGLAFAEDGSELYVSFTDLDGDTVIAAYAVADGEVVADERRTVLTQQQPYSNHNGGDIQVGPDGYLYIGLGDGGSGGDPLGSGQDTSTLLGAMLRIDPRGGDPYAVPDDNPFVDDPDAADEIWAFGLRNPWRFSFDRGTDDLWIGDVGQNSREEIDHLPAGEGAGANLGWNLMEGTQGFAGSAPEGHVPPVHDYATSGGRCAVTGGYVYRGDAIPELVGAYLFSDYCEALVRAIVVEDGEVVDAAELGLSGGSHVSFAQDADGELYVLDLDGSVSRIDPA